MSLSIQIKKGVYKEDAFTFCPRCEENVNCMMVNYVRISGASHYADFYHHKCGHEWRKDLKE